MLANTCYWNRKGMVISVAPSAFGKATSARFSTITSRMSCLASSGGSTEAPSSARTGAPGMGTRVSDSQSKLSTEPSSRTLILMDSIPMAGGICCNSSPIFSRHSDSAP